MKITPMRITPMVVITVVVIVMRVVGVRRMQSCVAPHLVDVQMQPAGVRGHQAEQRDCRKQLGRVTHHSTICPIGVHLILLRWRAHLGGFD